MSTDGEGRAAKSRKSAAKVGGEFGAVGGIVLLGGVLAAGIAAGAIACLRRRSPKKQENRAEKPSEKLSLEDKLAVPMSENVEEVEPILEIANMEKLSVENFSSMDLELSANEKSVNRSKGDDSPRSHFSLCASFGTSASVSSDSEDLVEINQMSFKENDFVPLEESSGKASFGFGVGRESESASGKELVQAEVEYEESVDSFDGLEDSEEVGGQKVNGCGESGQSSLVCEESSNAENCVEFVSGYREDDKICMEGDGSMQGEKFHVPLDRIDAADVSCGGEIAEIDVLKVFEEDLCVDREEKDSMGAGGKEETVLFNKEALQEKVGGSEGLNCDERGEHGEVDMSEECLGAIQEQSQQKMVGTNQEVLFCKEECQQEKFESNEGRCGEENTDTEESDNHMVNDSFKKEQCGVVVFRDFEDLDYNGGVSHFEEKCQHGESEFSEETSCHTEEEIQQESVKPEELEITEVDDNCCQDTAPQDLSNAKEEVDLCKEQKTFESNVEQYLLERPNSEEKPEEREVDLAHQGEQFQHRTVNSKGFEVLEYEGDFRHSDGSGQQEEEFLEQNCSPINERAQNKESGCGEAELHDLQDGHGQVSVEVNEYMLQCEEQSILEENLDSNVKQYLQENTDTEDDHKGCHVDTANKGEQCQHRTVDFCGLEGLDYKGGSNNCEEVGHHGELEDSEENLLPINEQSQQETLNRTEMDVEVPIHQVDYKSEPDGANKEDKFVLNVKECSQEKTDCIAALANKDEQCEIGTVDCRNFGGLGEDALHENGSCQYGTVGPRELDDLNGESHSEKGQVENEMINQKEDIRNEEFEIGSLKSKEDIEDEQFESGRRNSKEVVELNIGLEEKLRLQEENIREPQEALELSAMEMEFEENAAVHSKDTDVDGDAHIFKEKPQEEAMDSNESQNVVEHILLNQELCKGTTCESEESEFVEENMPIAQEEYKQEMVNSIEIQDSVECIPVTTLQCHREINESDELEGVAIPEEKFHGDAVYLELLELSDNMPSHNEPSEQEERLGEQSLPSQEEIVALKEENDLEFLNQCKQSQNQIPIELKVEADCIAGVVRKGEQCQLGTVDSRNIGGLDEDVLHKNGSCQYGAVGQRELDGLNRDSQSEKGQVENERLNSKEDIQNEQFENQSLKLKEDIENGQFENRRLNSKEVVELDIGLEEKLSLQEENIKEPKEALEVSVMEMEFEENTVHSKEIGVDGDAHISKEKPQEESMDSNESHNVVEDITVNHELCKGTICESEETEFVEENMPIIQEEYKHEIVNAVDIQDSVECIPVTTLQCHREINEADELEDVAIPGEKHQGDGVYLEQLELSDNLLSHNEPSEQEKRLGEHSLPSHEEVVALEEANDLEYPNQWKQLLIELKEETDCIAAEVHKVEQCQLGTVDSRNIGGLDKDALHENGSCQYGAVGPRELHDLNRDSHSEKGHLENERLNSKEDIQNELFGNGSLKSKQDIENEQFENARLNSKEVVELDNEEKLSLQEENIKEPQEALEVSVMEMESEESAVNSKETGVDKDAHIFKEKPQEESMDSNESQNVVEDIIVNHELCKATTCESEESKIVEENMPVAQGEYKQEIVNTVDIQDSVEFIPVATLQCHREINEADELEGAAIPGEKYQGDAVYFEQLELSDNLHSHNKPSEQEERLGEQSSPSQKETVGLKETNDLEYLYQCKQSQEKEIDTKDLGHSSSIVLELSLNDPDCTEAYGSSHEDPQTYNKAEVISTKDSEYSYGYTIENEKYQLETVDQVEKEKNQQETVDQVEKEKNQQETVDQVEKEKYQQETVDQVVNNDYSEDQEICSEQEEVNEENLSAHTNSLNDQNEANQDISTTPMSEREISNTNSFTKGEKKGRAPLHSSQLVSNSEEGKPLWMKSQRPLYMRTRIIVSFFIAILAFLFAYKLANMAETVYAT